MEVEATTSIAGVKRPLEEPSAPPLDASFAAAPPTASDAAATDAAAPTGGAPQDATQAVMPAASLAAPSAGVLPEEAEEASLRREAEYLKQHNAQLQTQLAQLQQQHSALTAAAASAAAMQQQQQRPAAAAAPAVVHNQAWTEQKNPENGVTYYWNKDTGESTYTRPHDFNPGAASATSSLSLPNTKGPAGANLFVVRRMRNGEYDEFNDADLVREFSKYGTVTRAQMTINRDNGWSKGFGFVGYGTVEEADAAMQV